eukprot:7230338-Pyramimonas_sp.AAC.1
MFSEHYRVSPEVPLAQGTPRILGVAQTACRAPLTRPRGPRGLKSGAKSWGHLGPGALLVTPDILGVPRACRGRPTAMPGRSAFAQ